MPYKYVIINYVDQLGRYRLHKVQSVASYGQGGLPVHLTVHN